MTDFHTPVMPKEVIHYLNIKPNFWYVDCNLGGGGHTKVILEAGGKVLGIDLDPDATLEVNKKYSSEIDSGALIICQSNFSDLKKIVEQFKLEGKVFGILFDLGVSSHQLETPKRGFSFNLEAPLDMRMNAESTSVTATDLINALHEKELTELFWKFGEERFSRPITRKIVEAREKKPIQTTNELAQIILSVRHTSRKDRTHPATRVFQALRIAVNDELYSLELALPQALEILNPEGRLVVISFHSLEDRIVKNFFKNEYKKSTLTILTRKPIIPSKEEVKVNPRSHSGKLRAAEKN